MKRLHVSISVKDMDQSTAFYTTLFGAEPTVAKPGYAKWMLDDPRVNFVIDQRCGAPGVDHLGIQAEDAAELRAVTDRLKAAGRPVIEQEDAACCYARSDKTWSADPQGVTWETFYTHGTDETVYGDNVVRLDELIAESAAD